MINWLSNKFETFLDWVYDMDHRTFYEHKETGEFYMYWNDKETFTIMTGDTEELKDMMRLYPVKLYVNPKDEKDMGYSWGHEGKTFVTKAVLKSDFKKSTILKRVKEL
jgi:hypothetical protein